MFEYVVVYPQSVDSQTIRLPLILKKQPILLKEMLNLPGGKINFDENPIDAAIRELNEETGLEEVQEYDGMCYCPPEHMGLIECIGYVIHCVKVPVCSRQELNQRPGEIEEVQWFPFPDLLNLPNLMPNLRIIIPLIVNGVKDWVIKDVLENWRKQSFHAVEIRFKGMESSPVTINVRSVGYFTKDEEEE